MTDYPLFQVDAFASKAFQGNPACVMPMSDFLSDDMLQAIAAENNVAETAYIVPAGEGRWKLRWFTPTTEVPLCGHATLASAHILFTELGFDGDRIIFETVHSGELIVQKTSDGYEMDFPRPDVTEISVDEAVVEALGARPVAAYSGPFLATVFETAADVTSLNPDIRALGALGVLDGCDRGNIGCLAVDGNDVDVTSRFFAPASGIDEDPATGSWHCMLSAVMVARTGRTELACYQAFPGRGAYIGTRCEGQRIKLSGQAVTIISGKFAL